jgi:hypothetical protein
MKEIKSNVMVKVYLHPGLTVTGEIVRTPCPKYPEEYKLEYIYPVTTPDGAYAMAILTDTKGFFIEKEVSQLQVLSVNSIPFEKEEWLSPREREAKYGVDNVKEIS